MKGLAEGRDTPADCILGLRMKEEKIKQIFYAENVSFNI